MSKLVRYRRSCLSRLKNRNQHIRFSTTPATQGNNHSTLPDPPPIRVGVTESSGRGVFATRRIEAGELLHTAKPVVAHPSLSCINSVCYFCLKKLTSRTDICGQDAAFCGLECEEKAKVFLQVERRAGWSAFNDYCWDSGLKYPFMVKRLACMVIAGAASSDSLDILQPANVSHEMALKMEEGFGLMRTAFTEANIADETTDFLTNQWYVGVLARIRINAFRIELAMGSFEDLLLSAAACVDAEAAVGNAVYVLPSFYNHDCDPNTHIVWIDNTDARLKTLRDVEEGEELRICYIDASMDHEARQAFLYQGFGFKCMCARCLSKD